ncbi:flagellar basal body-associated FliL family protein [Subtercola endophyticus]|uniref:hypothetical protein n=1 Tax=Subtercola endophyticus TaxID=2895559 RepID=UPI001E5AAD59|nr:hypothetical protein [Subtercola endophyticus]UFS60158.1 hypothetical protein LQ955_05190 [Subtercola endophyticus]
MNDEPGPAVNDDDADEVTAAPTATTTEKKRHPRLRRRIIIGAIAVVLAAGLGGGYWAWNASAQSRETAAATSVQTQLQAQIDAAHAFNARLSAVQGVTTRIHSVVESSDFAADALAEAAPLGAALSAMDALAKAAPADPPATTTPNEPAGETAGYRWPWQLTSDAEHLESQAAAAERAAADLRTAAAQTADAGRTLASAEAAYFAALAAHANATITDSPLSNRSIQAPLTELIDEAQNPSMSASRDGTFLTSMVDAEARVRDSQATNQAHLNDPAWSVRNEIESYARSLSDGVALEFVWAPEVAGYGEDWLSGTTQTWDTNGSNGPGSVEYTYAIISLNYSVEEAWNDGPDARALVTHEVGHSQMYRCWPQYSGPSFSRNDETWATAWSISYGFDVPGSGIEAYGRPTDDQISVAGQCH